MIIGGESDFYVLTQRHGGRIEEILNMPGSWNV